MILEKVNFGVILKGQEHWLTVEYLFPGKEDNKVIVKFDGNMSPDTSEIWLCTNTIVT